MSSTTTKSKTAKPPQSSAKAVAVPPPKPSATTAVAKQPIKASSNGVQQQHKKAKTTPASKRQPQPPPPVSLQPIEAEEEEQVVLAPIEAEYQPEPLPIATATAPAAEEDDEETEAEAEVQKPRAVPQPPVSASSNKKRARDGEPVKKNTKATPKKENAKAKPKPQAKPQAKAKTTASKGGSKAAKSSEPPTKKKPSNKSRKSKSDDEEEQETADTAKQEYLEEEQERKMAGGGKKGPSWKLGRDIDPEMAKLDWNLMDPRTAWCLDYPFMLSNESAAIIQKINDGGEDAAEAESNITMPPFLEFLTLLMGSCTDHGLFSHKNVQECVDHMLKNKAEQIFGRVSVGLLADPLSGIIQKLIASVQKILCLEFNEAQYYTPTDETIEMATSIIGVCFPGYDVDESTKEGATEFFTVHGAMVARALYNYLRCGQSIFRPVQTAATQFLLQYKVWVISTDQEHRSFPLTPTTDLMTEVPGIEKTLKFSYIPTKTLNLKVRGKAAATGGTNVVWASIFGTHQKPGTSICKLDGWRVQINPKKTGFGKSVIISNPLVFPLTFDKKNNVLGVIAPFHMWKSAENMDMFSRTKTTKSVGKGTPATANKGKKPKSKKGKPAKGKKKNKKGDEDEDDEEEEEEEEMEVEESESVSRQTPKKMFFVSPEVVQYLYIRSDIHRYRGPIIFGVEEQELYDSIEHEPPFVLGDDEEEEVEQPTTEEEVAEEPTEEQQPAGEETEVMQDDENAEQQQEEAQEAPEAAGEEDAAQEEGGGEEEVEEAE